MVFMLETLHSNQELDIELSSFIDAKQNIWFEGKEIATILGYNDTDQALRKHVWEENKKKTASEAPRQNDGLLLSHFYQ